MIRPAIPAEAPLPRRVSVCGKSCGHTKSVIRLCGPPDGLNGWGFTRFCLPGQKMQDAVTGRAQTLVLLCSLNLHVLTWCGSSS